MNDAMNGWETCHSYTAIVATTQECITQEYTLRSAVLACRNHMWKPNEILVYGCGSVNVQVPANVYTRDDGGWVPPDDIPLLMEIRTKTQGGT